MNFKILSREDVSKYISDKDPILISVISSWDTSPVLVPKGVYKNYLRLCFDDIDMQMKGCVLFEEEDARKIVNFVLANPTEEIVAHCDMGISRSAGIIAAIKKHLTGNSTEIFTNKQYFPNMRVYNLILKAFNEGAKRAS